MPALPDRACLTRAIDLRVGDTIAYLTPDAINFSTVTDITEGSGGIRSEGTRVIRTDGARVISADGTTFPAYSEVYLMSRAAPPDEPLTVLRDVTVRVDSRGKTPARPYTATYPLMVRSRSGWTGYLNERDSHDMDYFPADHVHEFIEWSPVT